MLVSHDRAFLSETAHEIVLGAAGEARHWRGGWNTYERERDAERERARAEHDRALERRAKLAAAEQDSGAPRPSTPRPHAHDNDKHPRRVGDDAC